MLCVKAVQKMSDQKSREIIQATNTGTEAGSKDYPRQESLQIEVSLYYIAGSYLK